MKLKCGIIGLVGSGKTTLFNCMSNSKVKVSDYAFSSKQINFGIATLIDKRLVEISTYIKSEKITHPTLELIDIPGISKSQGIDKTVISTFLSEIRTADILIHVIRCFENDNFPHVEGSINPIRDKEIIDIELQLKDYEQIEKKLLKVEKALKSGEKSLKNQFDVLKKFHSALQNFTNIRDLELNENDKMLINELNLFTAKPIIYVCNVNENYTENNGYVKQFIDFVKHENTKVIVLCCALEAEIASLENEEEKKEFLKYLGLEELNISKVIRAIYEVLDLITFFTVVGGKENRAWVIKKGTTAQRSASLIHKDMEKGFIKAEVIAYEDFIKYKSEQACKENGKVRLEGKDYIVQDGDIIKVRFNI